MFALTHPIFSIRHDVYVKLNLCYSRVHKPTMPRQDTEFIKNLNGSDNGRRESLDGAIECG